MTDNSKRMEQIILIDDKNFWLQRGRSKFWVSWKIRGIKIFSLRQLSRSRSGDAVAGPLRRLEGRREEEKVCGTYEKQEAQQEKEKSKKNIRAKSR